MIDHPASQFDKLLIEREGEHYVLRLYVTGMTPQSTEAVACVKQVCEKLLAGHYQLEIVDLYERPERAMTAQVIAAPTLVKEMPLPLRRIIGNLHDAGRVEQGLRIPGAR